MAGGKSFEWCLDLKKDMSRLCMEGIKVPFLTEQGEDLLWKKIKEEAFQEVQNEPVLATYLYSTILAHSSLEMSLAFHLANKLSSPTFPSTLLFNMILDIFAHTHDLSFAIREDMEAVKSRDPACASYSQCLLNFKGFLACQSHRVAHELWNHNRRSLALALQNRVSEVFGVDIHPAAVIGKRVMLDHATGIVIGETATVGDDVSILHHVTLGGTGAHVGDRHPKIGNGVFIGAGASILGPVRIGHRAKIGAGSIVLTEVPDGTTAVGNPARIISRVKLHNPGHIMDWSDYEI